MVKRKKTAASGNNPLNSTGGEKRITRNRTVKKKTGKEKNIQKSGDGNRPEKKDTPCEMKNNTGETLLKLDNILSINNIDELYKTLHNLLDADNDIVIDASDTQSVDTAILQLLTAFCLKVNKNGHSIKWKNPTQAFIDRCCLLNLEESLKLN